MASLMEELLSVLSEEEAQYEALVELGNEKKDAVIRADIEKLEQVTAAEEAAASAVLNLSNRRSQVLNDMATVLGKEPGEVTVSKMIGYLESQPVEQERLIRQRESLLAAGARMRTLNEQNVVLLQQALEMVEFDLTLIRSMRQAPETANYNKNAYNTGELLGGSGFDAKQ